MTSEEKRKALERRRLQAGRLLRKGVSKAEVARRLGVAPSTVTGWAQRLEQGGLEALKSRGRWGQRRGLDDAQRQALAEALKAGALAAGFATELWTLPRIGCSSSGCSGGDTATAKSGASCKAWDSVRSGPLGARWNATRRPSGSGRRSAGLG